MNLTLTGQASQHVQIAQIEAAINTWRNRSPAPQSKDAPLVLCREARVLADVYGAMIIARIESVALSSLSPAQLSALQKAFA